MRHIPPAMQAALDEGVTTHCTVWRVARSDGAVFGFTDQDRVLDMDGLACRPGAGFGAGPGDQGPRTRSGLEAGEAGLAGALDDAVLTDADIKTGLWDGAEVGIWRVDWRDPSLRVRLWSGRLGEIRRQGAAFETELHGLAAGLHRVTGRVFSRRCDAVLGDARCGVSGDHPDIALGCDQRFATCRDRFSNSLNFRGFPHLIGNDALIASPAAEARRDGSTRGIAE